MIMIPSVAAAVVLLALTAAPRAASAQPLTCSSGLLASIAADGSVVAGSKAALRQAANEGLPMRVGWALDADGDSTPDVAHWSDAAFLTLFEGEVFAQVPDIQRQQPVRSQARVRLAAGRQRWSAVLGSTGRLEGHFDDGSEPSTMRVASVWCRDPRAATCAPHFWLVYRHDADGRPLEGTRQALLDAVRRGVPLRFAWGASIDTAAGAVTVEHTAEPVFVSIMRGEHVFVQLPEHIAQASYVQPEQARFQTPSVMWRGLMGSDGTFDAVMVDRATGAEVRRLPQRAGVAWFAELPGAGCDLAAPLELAVPGGVRAAPRP
jgi:hypothetical protein